MAIATRSSSGASRIGAGSLTLPVPAGTQNGDIMLAEVTVSASANVPGTPAGWTPIDSIGTGPSAQTYFRIASAEPASYDFAVAADAAGAIGSYSGGNVLAPINAHGAFNKTAASSTVTATTITPTVNGCMLVFFGGEGGPVSAFVGPAGFTQEQAVISADICVLFADVIQAIAGATGSISATFTGSVNCQGTLVALAPATRLVGRRDSASNHAGSRITRPGRS